jgi:hypothetical protein
MLGAVKLRVIMPNAIMLSVIKMIVLIMCVIMLRLVMPYVIMPYDIMLCVIMACVSNDVCRSLNQKVAVAINTTSRKATVFENLGL